MNKICCWSGCRKKAIATISYIDGKGNLNMCDDCYQNYLRHCDKREELFVQEERERCIKIIKSHIGSTYPINCGAIINEILENDKEVSHG